MNETATLLAFFAVVRTDTKWQCRLLTEQNGKEKRKNWTENSFGTVIGCSSRKDLSVAQAQCNNSIYLFNIPLFAFAKQKEFIHL